MQAQLSKDEKAVLEAVELLAKAADDFEGYRHPHAARVAELADELARGFGLGSSDRITLQIAALGHDLGEMAMGRDYIRRNGPLNEAERVDLARHAVIGEQELTRLGAGRGSQLLVRWHHEWWNGAGYPDALHREQIPLSARILRVADAYAALTDERPFRPARTEEEARLHLSLWAGIEFDPRVVAALLALQGVAALRSYARRDEPMTTTAPVEQEAETVADHSPVPAAEDDAELANILDAAFGQTTPAGERIDSPTRHSLPPAGVASSPGTNASAAVETSDAAHDSQMISER